MLIDRLMPEFDATRIEHRVVAARVSNAYAAAVGIDFVDPVRESHALRGFFALRAATGRIASGLRRSGSTVTAGRARGVAAHRPPRARRYARARLTRCLDGRSGATGESLRHLSAE
jgi:hypothetical protein